MTLADLGRALGVTTAAAGRYCRALTDPTYRQPNPDAATKIAVITGGRVHLGLLVAAPCRAAKRAARKQAGTDLTPRSHKVIPCQESPQ